MPEFTTDGVLLKKIKDFDLDETFNCGQCFRFNRTENGNYVGVAKSKVIELCQTSENVLLKNVCEEEFNLVWKNFFDLDEDYSALRKKILQLDSGLKKFLQFAPGIRILKQDPWEALCSFIVSQNNNIPRIKGIVERLCSNFGEKICGGFCTFPTAKKLACLKECELEPLRAGFRSKYILDAAKKVSSKEVDLEKVKDLPLPQARELLMKINGVGAKVAECTLLYGMHRLDAFPMDVWMKKAMQYFFKGKNIENFGPYKGLLQQYIFHYCRQNKNIFSKGYDNDSTNLNQSK